MKVAFPILQDMAFMDPELSRKDAFVISALENRGLEVNLIHPAFPLSGYVYKSRSFFTNKILAKLYKDVRTLWDREPALLEKVGVDLSKQIDSSYDIILSPSTLPAAYLECDQPVVIWVDATFAGMVDFYGYFSNLSAASIRKGNKVESRALEGCEAAVFSSDWAAETALRNYDLDPERLHVIPFGPNLHMDTLPQREDIEKYIKRKVEPPYQLLYLGMDWERKGGQKAVQVVERLNQLGYEAELVIVGDSPYPDQNAPGFIKSYGIIDIDNHEGRGQLHEVLSETSFLLLPVLADCAPRALNEAGAYGVPSFTSKVGGISTIINQGVNGFLFDVHQGVEDFCDTITIYLDDPYRYKELALSSFAEYQSRLSWKVSTEKMIALMEGLISSG